MKKRWIYVIAAAPLIIYALACIASYVIDWAYFSTPAPPVTYVTVTPVNSLETFTLDSNCPRIRAAQVWHVNHVHGASDDLVLRSDDGKAWFFSANDGWSELAVGSLVVGRLSSDPVTAKYFQDMIDRVAEHKQKVVEEFASTAEPYRQWTINDRMKQFIFTTIRTNSPIAGSNPPMPELRVSGHRRGKE